MKIQSENLVSQPFRMRPLVFTLAHAFGHQQLGAADWPWRHTSDVQNFTISASKNRKMYKIDLLNVKLNFQIEKWIDLRDFLEVFQLQFTLIGPNLKWNLTNRSLDFWVRDIVQLLFCFVCLCPTRLSTAWLSFLTLNFHWFKQGYTVKEEKIRKQVYLSLYF